MGVGTDRRPMGVGTGGVKASRIEIMLAAISLSSFGATSWSFPAMHVWFEVINPSDRESGMRRIWAN